MQFILYAIGILFLICLVLAIFQVFWVQIVIILAVAAAVAVTVFALKKRKEKAAQAARQAALQQSKAERAARAEKFRALCDSVPRASVEVEDRPPKLRRQTLSSMPEYAFSNITTKTDRTKLRSFIVIDTETTGVRAASGRIVELSAVRFDNFRPVEVWSTLINPGQPIPPDATAINHITDEMVEDAPQLSQVADSFVSFVGDLPVVGYNLGFDLEFIWTSGVDIMADKRRYYDALQLSRKAYAGELRTYKLVDVADHIGLATDGAHRSAADCMMTGFVFAACVRKIQEG